MPVPRVSILIPARNDAAALGRTLDHLAGVAGIEAAEIIVAAAGDPAGTARAVGRRARLLWPDDDYPRRPHERGGRCRFRRGVVLRPCRLGAAERRAGIDGGGLLRQPRCRWRLRASLRGAGLASSDHLRHQPSPLPAHAKLLRRPGDFRPRSHLSAARRLPTAPAPGGSGLQPALEADGPLRGAPGFGRDLRAPVSDPRAVAHPGVHRLAPPPLDLAPGHRALRRALARPGRSRTREPGGGRTPARGSWLISEPGISPWRAASP